MIARTQRANTPISTAATNVACPVTTVAITPARGIFRKHRRARFSPANIAWEKSMPFANQISDRGRSSPRRTDPHRIRGLQPGHDGQPAPSLPRDRAPKRQMPSVLSSLTVTALCAGNALPGLVLAVFSWVIAEFFSGCAAYARGMYALPPPQSAVPPPIAPGDGQTRARRRDLELQNLDDPSQRDIGRLRCDIDPTVRYGVRRE
jgi:hypothetical protein